MARAWWLTLDFCGILSHESVSIEASIVFKVLCPGPIVENDVTQVDISKVLVRPVAWRQKSSATAVSEDTSLAQVRVSSMDLLTLVDAHHVLL